MGTTLIIVYAPGLDFAPCILQRAAGYEEDTEADRLSRAGFTGDQVQELRRIRIRWPLMSQEESDRRELNSLLNELER